MIEMIATVYRYTTDNLTRDMSYNDNWVFLPGIRKKKSGDRLEFVFSVLLWDLVGHFFSELLCQLLLLFQPPEYILNGRCSPGCN